MLGGQEVEGSVQASLRIVREWHELYDCALCDVCCGFLNASTCLSRSCLILSRVFQ
jgi:hypothetical protein